MKVPLKFIDIPRWVEMIAQALNQLDEGKSSNTGSVTLTVSVTTTTVQDKRVGKDSYINFGALTANAAAEIPNMYVSTKTPGQSFVITHRNLATADRTFKYTIIG